MTEKVAVAPLSAGTVTPTIVGSATLSPSDENVPADRVTLTGSGVLLSSENAYCAGVASNVAGVPE